MTALHPISHAIAGAYTAAAVTNAAPTALADVALINGRTAAAAASISVSHFHDLVRQGLAPQPAFRAPRCTRWRLADVRQWLLNFAQHSTDAADAVIDKADRASKAARAKRTAVVRTVA